MTPSERANSHVARGEWKEAVRYYREAIAAAPRDAGPHIGVAFALMQLGDTPAARDALQSAVALDPSAFDAYYLLGQIAREDGDSNAAVAYFRDAIHHKRDFGEAHRELIATLMAEDPREAMNAATHAVEIFPNDAQYWFYRGAACGSAGQRESAIASYQRASDIQPGALPARRILAQLLAQDKRFEEALPHSQAWAALAPEDPDGHLTLGTVQFETGNKEDAITSYRRSLAIRPHEGIEYIVAFLTGKVLERAPDEYIARLFDGYASNFDSHLVGTLKYSIPRQIAAMLKAGMAGRLDDVLDLGSGTGLVGMELAGIASNIVGVDVSEKMLEKARERNVYKRLERADLVTMMAKEPNGGYDLVVAADVFVYIGKLDAAFEHAFRLLRPSGLFVFSVEAATGRTADAAAANGYVLHEMGRYAHTKDYLQHLAATAGFVAVEVRETVVRENHGVPIPALLVAYRRT